MSKQNSCENIHTAVINAWHEVGVEQNFVEQMVLFSPVSPLFTFDPEEI